MFCFAFKKNNHDLTRIKRRMLNHCELTNETHLHSSKQLPLIHGVTGYIKKVRTAKPPVEGTTSCVYQSMLAGFSHC